MQQAWRRSARTCGLSASSALFCSAACGRSPTTAPCSSDTRSVQSSTCRLHWPADEGVEVKARGASKGSKQAAQGNACVRRTRPCLLCARLYPGRLPEARTPDSACVPTSERTCLLRAPLHITHAPLQPLHAPTRIRAVAPAPSQPRQPGAACRQLLRPAGLAQAHQPPRR